MKAISKCIRISDAELGANPNSIFHIFYKDEKAFRGGRYHVPFLLKIGFLLCRHFSDDTAAMDLWYLVNPKLADHIDEEEVLKFVDELMYIAIDLPLKYM